MKKIKNYLKYFISLAGILLFANPIFAQTDADIFGTLETPPGVDVYQANPGAGDIGIIFFVSRMIRVVTIIAGIWVLFNVVLAGYQYLTGKGDSSAHSKVNTILTHSALGLLLIVATYAIAGLVGLIVFGDAGYILDPSIQPI